MKKTKINILLTSIIICFSLVAVSLVYIPKLSGYKYYVIETGSMEPTIEAGSLVFVKPLDHFADYHVNDVVTFTDEQTNKSFTHRIIEIDDKKLSFVTKGDANKDADPLKTEFDYAIGKVSFTIPFAGKIVKIIKTIPMKISIGIIYAAWLAIEIEIYLAERKKKYD